MEKKNKKFIIKFEKLIKIFLEFHHQDIHRELKELREEIIELKNANYVLLRRISQDLSPNLWVLSQKQLRENNERVFVQETDNDLLWMQENVPDYEARHSSFDPSYYD